MNPRERAPRPYAPLDGDIWIDTSADSLPHRYEQGRWVAYPGAHIGPRGMAMPVTNLPEGHTTLAAWLLDLPQSHPWWKQYLLSLVHLRPVEGYPAPNLQYPEAQYEVALLALDPGDPADFGRYHADMPGDFRFLDPPNVVAQFHGPTEEQAIRMTGLLAHGVVDGRLPAEPSDYLGGQDNWTETITKTVSHYMGGHGDGD